MPRLASQYPKDSNKMRCSKILRALVLGLSGITLSVLLYLKIEHGTLIDGAYHYFPYVPTHWFQAFSVWVLYYGTCLVSNPFAAVCRDESNKDELWVAVAAAKGGVVLAARSAVDIGMACGVCVGYGHRYTSLWPPIVEDLPTYKSDVLLALANMRDWPKYAAQHGGKVRCIVITRHPRRRFKSLYTYTLKGGEYGLLDLSKELRVVQNKSIAAGVDFLYREIGKTTLIDSMDYLSMSLSHPGCIQLKLEDFESNFNSTMSKWISHWGVIPSSRDYVLSISQKHDLKGKSEEDLKREHHTSGGVLSKEEKKELDLAIRNHEELHTLLKSHSQLLDYADD